MGHSVTTQTHSVSLEILYIVEKFRSERKELKNAIAVSRFNGQSVSVLYSERSLNLKDFKPISDHTLSLLHVSFGMPDPIV